MKTFYAQLNDGATVCRKADRFEIVNESIRVWLGNELVGFFDLDTELYAQIYSKGEKV